MSEQRLIPSGTASIASGPPRPSASSTSSTSSTTVPGRSGSESGLLRTGYPQIGSRDMQRLIGLGTTSSASGPPPSSASSASSASSTTVPGPSGSESGLLRTGYAQIGARDMSGSPSYWISEYSVRDAILFEGARFFHRTVTHSELTMTQCDFAEKLQRERQEVADGDWNDYDVLSNELTVPPLQRATNCETRSVAEWRTFLRNSKLNGWSGYKFVHGEKDSKAQKERTWYIPQSRISSPFWEEDRSQCRLVTDSLLSCARATFPSQLGGHHCIYVQFLYQDEKGGPAAFVFHKDLHIPGIVYSCCLLLAASREGVLKVTFFFKKDR